MGTKDHNDGMQLVLSHLNRIEQKIDRVDERLDGVEKVQLKQESNLVEHMRRSDLLEQNHQILKNSMDPVVSAYTVAWGICKVVLGVSILAGVLQFIYELRK